MRRVLNSFLQFIEQDSSDGMIIAASNNPRILDRALFRRFDDVLSYELPEPSECKRLVQNVLGSFLASRFGWKTVLAVSRGLSHGEIDHACRDAIKHAILTDAEKVNASLVRKMLIERKNAPAGRHS